MSGSNTHTEEEAMTKTCHNTVGGLPGGPLATVLSKCCASQCMAWQWAETPTDNVPRGSCGLLRRT